MFVDVCRFADLKTDAAFSGKFHYIIQIAYIIAGKNIVVTTHVFRSHEEVSVLVVVVAAQVLVNRIWHSNLNSNIRSSNNNFINHRRVHRKYAPL